MSDELEEKLDRLHTLCDRVVEERTFSSDTYYCMKEELPRLLKAVQEVYVHSQDIKNSDPLGESGAMANSVIFKLKSILIKNEEVKEDE